MIDEIRKAIEAKQAVIGKEQVLKMLKSGKLKQVVLASNAPEGLVKDVQHYAKLAGSEVKKIELDNMELGTRCKKPFSISILGLL